MRSTRCCRPTSAFSHPRPPLRDRKSTRLNSSHQIISYAVFCLKKKKLQMDIMPARIDLICWRCWQELSVCGWDFFFFNDTATTEIYTLSLHDALPTCPRPPL